MSAPFWTPRHPCANPGMQLLGEALDLMRFLFIGADSIEYNEKAISKLRDTAPAVLEAAAGVFEGLEKFDAEHVKAALDAKLVDEMGIKPRFAFGPLFVAMTGTNVSLPVVDSIRDSWGGTRPSNGSDSCSRSSRSRLVPFRLLPH